jgi:hypothetical protein
VKIALGIALIIVVADPTARLKSGAERRSEMVSSWRAETRRRYALARPCSASCQGIEVSRDVGFAKSGFRPTKLTTIQCSIKSFTSGDAVGSKQTI